jgi:hypothetical protein
MYQPPGCSTRSLAIGGLSAYGVTALLIVLTLAFPTFTLGATAGERVVSFPPQTVFAVLGGLLTLALAVALAGRCVVTSWRSRQWAWLPVFLLLSLAGLLGPMLLLTGVNISQASWNVVALVSAVGVFLVFVAALLSTLPSRRPRQA